MRNPITLSLTAGAMLISAALAAASGASAPSATAPAVSDSVIGLRMCWPPLKIQTRVLLEGGAGAELEPVSGGFGQFRQRAFIVRG